MAVGVSPYEYYLELLGNWSTGVALPTLWFCTFDLGSVGCLGNLSSQISRYESSMGSNGWKISNDTVRYLTSPKLNYASGNLMGCVFVKQVDIPSESINVNMGSLGYGGYMTPATASERKQYNELKVTFLETNASFIDMVIRPWTILVGYNGLVARSRNSPKNVKASICDMVMLAKTGAYSPLGIRKIYRFYNVAPYQVSGESYSHASDTLKTTGVSFAYDGYTVLDGQTPNIISYAK